MGGGGVAAFVCVLPHNNVLGLWTHTLSGDHRDQVNIFTTIVNIVLHILHTRERSPRQQM